MVEPTLPPLHTWLVDPLEGEVYQAIERLRRASDVQHVAVMPDVHLAEDVCIGVAIATTHLIYPQAVGGDIGCGILAVPFDIGAEHLGDPATAGKVLAALARAVPARRWNRKVAVDPPSDVAMTRSVIHNSTPSGVAMVRSSLQLWAVAITSLNCRRTATAGYG